MKEIYGTRAATNFNLPTAFSEKLQNVFAPWNSFPFVGFPQIPVSDRRRVSSVSHQVPGMKHRSARCTALLPI